VDFYKTKDEMVEPTCEKLNNWIRNGVSITALRMDNAGENVSLSKQVVGKDWKLPIKIEFTARDTPQQNGIVEVKQATIFNRAKAKLNHANIPLAKRGKFFMAAAQTACKEDGLVVISHGEKQCSRYEHIFGKLPDFAKHLRQWGEAGVVKIKTKTSPKIDNKGITCMFVGYATNHAGDVYYMFNPTTEKILVTRDIVWLNRMFYNTDANAESVDTAKLKAGKGTNYYQVLTDESDDDDTLEINDELENEFHGSDNNQAADNIMTTQNVRRSTRTNIGRRTVMTFAEEQAQEIDRIRAPKVNVMNRELSANLSVDSNDMGEMALVGTSIGGGFSNTQELHVMKYKQAMEGQDAVHWQKAVYDEYKRMVENKVFQVVKRNQVPKHAKILTSTWAMKKKANGKFRARLNARGFEQVDGVHYNSTNKAAPVVNEITIVVVLIMIVMADWYAELLDVKSAFLHGTFEDGHEMYMYVPEGFESYYPTDSVLLLLRTIYGTCQAAHAFWMKLLVVMKVLGMERNKTDPCLYYSWTEQWGLIIWLSWVDDLLVCGKKEGVLDFKKKMMEQWDCDEQGTLKEYIGCKIDRDIKNGWMKLTQPVLIQSFKDEFELPDGAVPVTPMAPGELLTPVGGEDALDSKLHSEYRAGVGKLIYLMKKTRHEISNAVRELSKQVQSPGIVHLKNMYRVMKHVASTSEKGKMLKPGVTWDGNKNTLKFRLWGQSDSDHAKDPVTRRSVSGYATFLFGAPTNGVSRMQKTVSLSVNESETNAIVECAQDLLFEKRLIESLGLTVEVPMIINTDSQSTVDQFNSWSVGGRTRHSEAKMMWLRELKEEGVLDLQWVPSEQNFADLLTKNLPGADFDRHAKIFTG
jgi:Reverse transcriptase (RNA-dependent DNA polymerase)